MKSFEIPASCGFMLAPKTAEHKFFFKNSRSIILYETIGEIPKLLNRISLIPENKKKKLVKKTQNWIIKNHSYDQRVIKLLNKLKKL
jgi:spore maturation protein CgeB